jgi:hypothetical protein
MIINPSLPSGFVTFCDDIRHEVTGKMTLVGVYGGQMVVGGTLPITLPQICAVITFRFLPPSEPIKPAIKIFITGQDEPLFMMETEIVPAQAEAAVARDIPSDEDPYRITFAQMVITPQIQGLVIKEASTIKVRAYIGDDEIRLGALSIMVAPDQPINLDAPA